VAVGAVVIAARFASLAARIALLPTRAAARAPGVAPRVRGTTEALASTGRAAERRARRRVESAADEVLSGPLPEAAARSLVEHHLAERLAKEARAAVARDERALPEAEDTIDELVAQVLASPAFERALGAVVEKALSSPEVHAAITRQTATFGEQLVGAARVQAAGLDDRVERPVRRHERPPGPYAGVASRGVGLFVDAALVNLVYIAIAGAVGLLGSLVGTIRPTWVLEALAGSGWAVLVGGYFVFFWTVLGQTPGQWLMDVRVVAPGDRRPGVLRSIVRWIGLTLSIVPLCAGFLPVLWDRRRRALPDYLAGTVVVRGGAAPSSAPTTVDA
jgi:uncharacterized RDD family membrane protein YckC